MYLRKKEFCRWPFFNQGSILITLIITILIFSTLVLIMLSLTGTSIFSQINTSSTTRAAYIAKSGYNYLASHYKNAVSTVTNPGKNQALEDLHNVNFQLLNNNGSFTLNIEPYYLRATQALTVTNTNGQTLTVKFPGAVTYTIPSSATDKVMAVYKADTVSGYRRFYYTTVTTLGTNNYRLALSNTNPPDGQPFTILVGESIVPVLALANNQTLTNGGNLTVAAGTGGIFPDRFGFFEIPLNTNTSNYVFYYDHRTGDTFFGIQDANTPTRTFSHALTTANGMIYAHTSAQINSTGTFNPGGSFITSNTFSRMDILGYKPGGNSDNVPHDIPGFNDWVTIGAGANGPGIAIDTTNQILQIGQGLNDTAGVAWYAGNSDSANCASGKCTFGTGIRVYFQFVDTNGSASSGDGFMFIVMNGILNDTTKRGGTVSGTGMGELMGYSGPGNTADGHGLQPPKFGVEIDRYNNAGITNAGCGFGRNDTAGNHMAVMYWGVTSGLTCDASYDDNVHAVPAVGTALAPRNSFSGDGTGGYYATSFANTNTRTFRMEISRAITPNVSGNYDYNVKAWIDCTACNDVSVPFIASVPQINRTTELDPSLHTYFNKMIFGFTQGTGGATQNIQISNFDIYFPQN